MNNCCGNPTGLTLEQVLDTALQRTSTASMRHLANVTSWLARFPAIPNETSLFICFFNEIDSMIFCNSRFLWFHVKQIYISCILRARRMHVCILRARRRCFEMMTSHVIERNTVIVSNCLHAAWTYFGDLWREIIILGNAAIQSKDRNRC